MAKYSKEQRDRAMDLHIRYERCAADVDWLQCIRQSMRDEWYEIGGRR